MTLPMASIYVGGGLTLLIAILHCRFHTMFGWAGEFSRISQLNARILYTIHVALLLLFFMLGGISIVFAREMSQAEGLSLALTGWLSLFWLWRLVWQLVYFRRDRGQRIPPVAVFFISVFFLQFVAYGLPVVYLFFR
jgi:hypothetical protein